MNKNTFKANMTALGEYFNKPQSEAISRMYWRKLRHLDDSDFIQAIDQCIDDCKFFPRIPEILSRAPEQPKLENKGSLSWCDTTQNLLNQYGEQA